MREPIIFKVTEQIPCGWDSDNTPRKYYSNVFMIDEAKLETFALDFPFEYASLKRVLYNSSGEFTKMPKYGFVGNINSRDSLTDAEKVYRKLEPDSRSDREIRTITYFVRN